jgi:hypothetical protein
VISLDNVAFVRRAYEVINAIGRTEEFVDPEELAPDFWSRLAPDFELHDRPDLPDARVYRGPEGSKVPHPRRGPRGGAKLRRSGLTQPQRCVSRSP